MLRAIVGYEFGSKQAYMEQIVRMRLLRALLLSGQVIRRYPCSTSRWLLALEKSLVHVGPLVISLLSHLYCYAVDRNFLK